MPRWAVDTKPAPERFDAISETAQAGAHGRPSIADTIVGDLDQQALPFDRDANRDVGSVRVFRHVRKCFRADEVGSHLDRGRITLGRRD